MEEAIYDRHGGDYLRQAWRRLSMTGMEETIYDRHGGDYL